MNEEITKTVTIEEFMIRKLGGQSNVVSEYLREVADLNNAGGSRRTLGEILAIAEEHSCHDWLLNLTLPEIAGYFYVAPDQATNKYSRRSKAMIAETRSKILNLMSSSLDGWTAADLGSALDIDPKELRRKDLPALKASCQIEVVGKGDAAVYSRVVPQPEPESTADVV